MVSVIKNAKVYTDGRFVSADIAVKDGVIADIASGLSASDDALVFDFNNAYVFPGFADVHVHFREPGFSYKETIKTGSMAAAHGGYTHVLTMPNLNPVPDSLDNLKMQLELIERSAVINVTPYGAITVGQMGETLSDMDNMAPYIAAFSDDGRGVQSDELMKLAMKKAKNLNKMIVAHCEVNSLLNGGYIHDGGYAKAHGHRGICSESEWRQIERDLALVRETGCSYHVCHVSAKESVELIRNAKREGLDVTCETGPHYLTLCDNDLQEHGRFKMNPPLRSKEDRDALINGISDGTVDIVATDHAPHSAEEKSRGLKDSAMGITGLETAFPIMYTKLVKKGIFSLEKLIELLNEAPRRRFNIGGEIKVGAPADLTVFDLEASYNIDPSEFLSMGKATPFEGEKVYGKCLMTMYNGNIVFKADSI